MMMGDRASWRDYLAGIIPEMPLVPPHEPETTTMTTPDTRLPWQRNLDAALAGRTEAGEAAAVPNNFLVADMRRRHGLDPVTGQAVAKAEPPAGAAGDDASEQPVDLVADMKRRHNIPA